MNIEKAAARFAKSFPGEITFASLKSYIEKRLHYKLLFFDTEIAERELQRLRLKIPRTEKSITVNAGTSRIVFLRSNLSEEDKVQCLLHECGHIVLGHADMPSREIDREKAGHEAERFSYAVLSNVKKHSNSHYKTLCVILLIVVFLQTFLLVSNHFKNSKTPSIQANQASTSVSALSNIDDALLSSNEQAFCVTPHGKKYHKSTCRYVKNKTDVIIIDFEKAYKNYDPCSVCNP